jgi:AhpD family alkylhydroperoxidase
MEASQWIPLVPTDELPHDLNLMARKWIAMENGDPNFIQTVGHVPETLRKYIRWSSPMWRKGYIQHRVKELCRIRIANSNECRYCMTMRYETAQKQGIDDVLESQLDDYESGDFTAAEKAALKYADEIYMDNITWDYDRVPDEVYRRLSHHFTEPEIVELTWAISVAIEYGRNFTAWGVPVTEDKVREPLDQLQERIFPKFDADREETNREALRQIAETRPRDAAALSTLLAKPEMLGPVITYYRFITDEGILEAQLKQAVKERILLLDERVADGTVPAAADTPRIATAIKWTDGMAVDFRQFVDNAVMAAEMHALFSDAEMVELGMYSGFSLILRRVAAVLGRRIELASYGPTPAASARA